MEDSSFEYLRLKILYE